MRKYLVITFVGTVILGLTLVLYKMTQPPTEAERHSEWRRTAIESETLR